MFRPTAPMLASKSLRKIRLNAKQASKDYYKGFRTGAMGRHTSRGGYEIDWRKVRTYVMPTAGHDELTPFVSKKIEKPKPSYGQSGPMDGAAWLAKWRESGWY